IVHFALMQNEPKNQEGFIGNFCLWQNHGCCYRYMLFSPLAKALSLAAPPFLKNLHSKTSGQMV
ncbi:MAG: hypothetical protein AAF361_08600, partial [Bacteroidota bacterium]